jgi:hypothetical protein
MVPVPPDMPVYVSKPLKSLRSLDKIRPLMHRETHARPMRLLTRRWGGLAFLLVVVSAYVREARADTTACFDAAEQAQLLRYNGDLVGARDKLMGCTSGECPTTVARDCTRWLGEVTQALPSLAIHARDSRGHDVIGAAVVIDGRRVAPQLGGIAVAINPGAHTIRLETPSGAVYDEKILAVEGQKERVLDATFPVALNVDGTRSEPPPERSQSAHGDHPVDGLALGFAAIGVSGIALATYFELAGQSEHSALEKGCGTSGTCSQGAVDSSKEKLYYEAPITFALGVVSMGIAAGLFFLGHPQPSRQATWQFGVTPMPWAGMMGVAAHRF